MTVRRDGEIIAFYLEKEIVCLVCATETERTCHTLDESLMIEELEGALEELWCDRCGERIFSWSSAVAKSANADGLPS